MPSQVWRRIRCRSTAQLNKATMAGAVNSSSSAMPTGSRSIAVK
jgi:hypothetical protein